MSRPPLKLKLSTSDAAPAGRTNGAAGSPPAGTPKLKLKFGSGSTPTEPSASSGSQPGRAGTAKGRGGGAAGRKPRKSSMKTVSIANGTSSGPGSKKRAKETQEEDGGPTGRAKGPKKLKITQKKPFNPIIKAKMKGRPPPRPLGVGYDSESSDREIDPAIEEEFILRMAPGEDCDYLRKAIEERKVGLSRSEGGADVSMKFFNREGRRALVTIRQRHYAATMVDLPCAVEGLKSWDKRGWWKSADICQMLVVFAQVKNEEDARTIPLPPSIDHKSHQWPHGLTAPMHNVRRRRFRKRISNRTIEAVEDEVERLLAADVDCERGSSRYELVDLDRTRDNSAAYSGEDSTGDAGGYDVLGAAGMQEAAEAEGEDGEEGSEDAEGEAEDDDDGANGLVGAIESGLEADLEMAMMMEQANQNSASGASGGGSGAAGAPSEVGDAQTPSAAPAAGASGAGADSSDEDADDEDGGAEIDEDALERQRDLQRQREEVADLEAAIKSQSVELERLTNPILRDKLIKKILSLKNDLQLKRGELGEDDE